ncbi:LysR substrate-binding domain-containing protein [Caulobacter soli]|uniref:LysR substrate-binding domain-containing protein n=1 Tax=Caulobacter soli TaxID=2708539 RepID=UPI0013EB1471|nr:LysR substrate-binding domain-containing protein [Caulobacter soli]
MASFDLPPLGALRAFEAAARLASFKRAAAELLVTPTAISHQVRQLEEHLGGRLLDRSPRRVALTLQGQILYEAAASSFAEIDRAVGRLRRSNAGAILTLSATPAFLSQWLVPRLTELQTRFPKLELRLQASDQIVELRPGGVDLAIRYGKGPFPGAATTALCQDAFAPVCSPSLRLRTVEDLTRARLIHIDGRVAPRPSPDWRRWCDQVGVLDLDTETGLRFTDSLYAVQATVAGQGVAIVSLVIAADALANGLLVAPFSQTLSGETYSFACAPALSERPDVVALRDWFVEAMTPF